ncbi:SH3 domain-containing protein [Minwuia thermotolerans]|uniref:SH3b domain-containing protein n=1 Tax=Minwuia thermotolerans TaxID=2056226 RepID=A0A2M9G7R6_9PROT|nr:SH3 domain-containing protein [Minwuia thermotolerans]PJK31743.1 hypothetical protein CVT23_00020 [Minwuia thermotolerans]
MKYLQYSIVIIAAAVLMYLGFEAQKQFRNTLEKNEVRNLLAKRAKLGTGKEVVSITESDFAGRYFFQVAQPGEDGVTVAYGWIEPEACIRTPEASCIEVLSGDSDLRASPALESVPPPGESVGVTATASESADMSAAEATTSASSPGSATETATSPASSPPAETPASQLSDTARYRVTASKVNVRAGPGTAYEVVDVMTPEATFVILETSDDWSKVADDGPGNPVEGWIWSELITDAE